MISVGSFVVTFALLIASFNCVVCVDQDYSLIGVTLTKRDHVDRLINLNERGLITALPDHYKVNATFVGRIDRTKVNQIRSQLGDDVKLNLLDEPLERSFNRRNLRIGPTLGYNAIPSIFYKYPRYGEMIGFINSLASRYPRLITLESIGRSFERRDLRLIKIGANNKRETKPILWIDAGIHAREWIAPITSLFIAYRLARDYLTDPETRVLLDTFDWYILPVVNPDGYEYTHTTDRYWRKTRSRSNSWSSNGNCVGVDANRNFDFHWMESGSSNYSCSDIYAGPRPFSEPETIAMKNYIYAKRNRMKLYLTLHSYAQQWLYPWGYAVSMPGNVADLERKAKVAINALSKKYGTKYEYGPSGATLYPAAGGSDDWALGVAGIPLAYTVELRPDSYSEMTFNLPPDQIIPVGEETCYGIKKLAVEIKKDL